MMAMSMSRTLLPVPVPLPAPGGLRTGVRLDSIGNGYGNGNVYG